jgi:purine-binding chemotaxis protein CheW
LSNDLTTICTFQLAHMRFGIPVNMIQEIIREQELTPVPLAPMTISGLLNLRGQIVTVVDLFSLFNEPTTTVRPEKMLYLVCTPRRTPMSLIIDKIGEVIAIDPTKVERAPDNMKGIANEVIDGAYQHQGELVLLFNVRRAINLIIEEVAGNQRNHLIG